MPIQRTSAVISSAESRREAILYRRKQHAHRGDPVGRALHGGEMDTQAADSAP